MPPANARSMRILAFLAILTVSAMALAGCSGDGGGDGDATSSSSSSSRNSSSATSTSRSSSISSSGSASSTSSGAPAENRAPTGSISVEVNGTNATFTLTGSDPDGDTLVWDLAFGDGSTANGTSLPAVVNHTFAVGNYTAEYVLTDGTDPVAYDLLVTVAASGATSFVITGSTAITGSPFSSGILADGTPGLGAKACSGFMTERNEQDCVFGEVPAEMAGRPYLYESSVDQPDFEFYDECAPTGTATQAFGGEVTGVVPDGTGCVIMWNFGSATGEFTMTLG